MTRKQLMMLVSVVALLTFYPLQALAQVCFQLSPFTDILEIGISGVGPPGDNLDLTGRNRGANCGVDADIPVSGAAHVRSAGNAHFAAVLYGSSTCFTVWVHGQLNPPSFNSGSGSFRRSNETSGALTLIPSFPCPISGHKVTGDGAGLSIQSVGNGQ